MVEFVFSPSTNSPLSRLIELSKLAEKYGFDHIWVTDTNPSPPSNETFMTLAIIAKETENIKIGVGICNPYTRHPAMIAKAVKTLYEIAGNRIMLGIGAGGMWALPPLDIEMWNKPIDTVRDAIDVIKRLLNGEIVSKKSHHFRVKDLKFNLDKPLDIPIWIGARRPRMLKLSGELATGVILASSPKFILHAKKIIEKGLALSKRKMSEFKIANWLPSSISYNRDNAREIAKERVVYEILFHPEEDLVSLGFDIELVTQIRNYLQNGLLDKAISLVTQEMIDDLAIAGTPEDGVRIIKNFINTGVTHVIFGRPFGENVKDALRIIGEEIIPVFKNQ